MNNELNNDIPADIRGKLRFPLDGLSGRASSEETAATFWLLLGQAKSDIPIWVKPKVTR